MGKPRGRSEREHMSQSPGGERVSTKKTRSGCNGCEATARLSSQERRKEERKAGIRKKEPILFGQLRNMFVFVFLNQDTENVHERSERMIFIFANFIGDTIE